MVRQCASTSERTADTIVMPTVLRIVIDTVTRGSAAKGKIIIRSIGATLRTAVVDLGRMPGSNVLHPKTGNEEVATPEADEWASDGRDVALGAPGVHEQIPIRNQREVEVEEQTQNCNPCNPLCQWRRQVGPPEPEAASENQRQEQEGSSGQATSQAEVLSCASTASMARGKPSGRAMMVRQSRPPTAWWQC